MPSIAPIIFGVLCCITAAAQLLGFIGVGGVRLLSYAFSYLNHDAFSQERPILFRRFLSLHSLLITAVFSLAAAFIILSATRHSDSKTRCTRDFFVPDPDNADDTLQKEANALCEIFPWVDVGVMGAIWVILAIVHASISCSVLRTSMR